MNTNKLAAALAVVLSVGSSFAATNITYKTNDNVVCITGSTAGRTQAANALDALYNGTNGWSRVARSSDFSGTDQKSTYRLYAKTPETNATTKTITRNFINVHWTGSEGGIQTIAAPAGKYNVGYLPLNASGDAYAVATASNFTYTNNASIAFSDVKQTVSRFIKTGAKNLGVTDAFATLPAPTELMVLNFVWAGSKNFPTNAANMTKDIAVELFNNGSVPLSRFTGDTNDGSKTVYLIGRNADSGTRCAALLTAGLPNSATIKQYSVAAGEVVSIYPDETINGLVLTNGMSGYASGSGVQGALGNLSNSTTTYAVGYLGKGDYSASKNVLMTFQGNDSTQANIRAGKYPMWTVYNAYKPKVLSPKVCDTNLVSSVYDALTAAIIAADKGANNVNVGDLTIKRSVDGGAISAK
jgi:hypothetical protein